MGISGRHVEAIIDELCDPSIASYRLAADGQSSHTFIIDFSSSHPKVVCKIGGANVYTDAIVEPLVVELVRASTSIPVPAVIATGWLPGQDHPNHRWAVYEHLAGHSPTPFSQYSVDMRSQLLFEIGAYLGQLHDSAQFDRFGAFDSDGDSLVLGAPRCPEMAPVAHTLLSSFAGSNPTDRIPVLDHGDLFPGNLLVDTDGKITGIVDWANAHVTTPVDALAKTELRFIDWFRFPLAERDRLRTALHDGYRQHRPLPGALDQIGWLYKVLWLTQSGVWAIGHLHTPHGRRQLRRYLRSCSNR